MKRSNFLELCMIVSILLLGMSAFSFAAPVSETGVTKCYDSSSVITCPEPGDPFYGQDANYTINPMSFTKLDATGKDLPDDAASWTMIRDNVTGLIWENKTNDGTIHDKDNVYTWYDSNPETNGGDPGTPGVGTDTEDFLNALNDARFGGYSDWRLPTLKELSYIASYVPFSSKFYLDPSYFPNSYMDFYWSSTTYSSTSSKALGLNFARPIQENDYKSIGYYVRAVRGTKADQDFTDNGNGTVTDAVTGLMWQQNSPSREFTWESALGYCENLNLGGHTDWRLPTIKELRSLVDFTLKSPSINKIYFPNAVASFYWSSTTYASYTSTAWGVSFYYGDDSISLKHGGYYVRAVRGGQSGQLGNLDISPLTRSVSKDAGTTTFSVSNAGTGAMTWTAAVTSGSGWLTITSGAIGTNSGTITCAHTANTTTSSRTATIRVTAPGATGSPKDVTVVQAGATTQSKSQFLGAWGDGVYAWIQSTKQWTKIPNTAGVSMIATGKVDNDAIDDLLGVWSSGLYVRQSTTGVWVKLNDTPPSWITAGDLNKDGRDEVIGSWKGLGVYYLDFGTGKWNNITSPALQLATGNVQGDGRDDLVGVWNDGLWVRYSATGAWQKINSVIPIWITTGDMTGSGRADIIYSYSNGTWYRNSVTAAWTSVCIPAEQLTAGDIDGDGRDDLVGVWSNGVWVRYGISGEWQLITVSKPIWITTGRL